MLSNVCVAVVAAADFDMRGRYAD